MLSCTITAWWTLGVSPVVVDTFRQPYMRKNDCVPGPWLHIEPDQRSVINCLYVLPLCKGSRRH